MSDYPAGPVQAGVPYQLLARDARHRWWRPLVALLVFAVLAFVLLLVAMLVLAAFVVYPAGFGDVRIAALVRDPESVEALVRDPFVLLFVSFGALVSLIPAAVLTALWVQRRSPRQLIGVTGRFRRRWSAECLLAALAVFAVAFAVSALLTWVTGGSFGPGFPGWADYGRVALLALVVVPVQSAAEEFAFRGFLLQAVSAWFRTPWPAIALTSLLFLLGHGYTDPLVWCQLLVMAVSMCWLVVRTGGLEAAIALHVVNNSLSLLVGGLGGVPGVEQAGDFPVGDVLPFIAAILAYAWWADRRAARRGAWNVTGGRVELRPWSLRPATQDDLRPEVSG
ncbi:CPBP family intramembrane glutamic endopeptidase [Saccharopolyspora sp. 6V]|uniref:CPBP family intramembrane glutamic endopeptidase n=1 Tax=Saccharopolyspora sp. 6V TaxID=2877239 RepID=UPI001CD548F6|nr:CPBP family intramembrane glutamic endopeptidase [Saccharopolyspora sp. 6V]MCA1192303.1 CPBP family intramembrane metalloprotease [Saccharopolyspora sp. 6V]